MVGCGIGGWDGGEGLGGCYCWWGVCFVGGVLMKRRGEVILIEEIYSDRGWGGGVYSIDKYK